MVEELKGDDELAGKDRAEKSPSLVEWIVALSAEAGLWCWEERIDESGRVTRSLDWVGSVPGLPLDHGGEEYLSLVHPEDRAKVRNAHRADVDFHIEYRLNQPGRGWRHFCERRETDSAGAGYPIRRFYALRDITDLRAMDILMQQREAWLDHAQDLGNLGFWVWHGKRVSEWDAGAPTAERKPLISKKYSDIFRLGEEALTTTWQPHPEDAARLQATLEDADSRHDRYEITYRIVDPAGAVRTIREVGAPSEDPETGAPIWMGIVQDITAQREAEEQLWQAQKMEAVGRLTGGVAHDFNNLLSIIIGNLEFAGETVNNSADTAAYIERALSAAERGANLVQRLLAFSRSQPLKPEPVDVDQLVRGMSELMRRTLGETIEIQIASDTGLWHCLVDRGQLENAILNLAINASDAMPNGGKLMIDSSNVSLQDGDAAALEGIEPGQYIRISVSDTGIGMPPDVLKRAFEPFFTTKDISKGSGLGLSMIYGFAKQSGGQATISSRPDKGTTVNIYLPRYEGGEAIKDEGSPAESMRPGRGEVVLLVEDDQDLCALIAAFLRSLCYEVMAAHSGPEALKLLERKPRVDLLVTDVVLPSGMNGRALAERIRASYAGLPVLYISGYSENVVIHHDRLDPAVDLLQKPFRKHQLARAVHKALASGS